MIPQEDYPEGAIINTPRQNAPLRETPKINADILNIFLSACFILPFYLLESGLS